MPGILFEIHNVPSQNCPCPWRILTPIKYIVQIHKRVLNPNDISIGLAVFAELALLWQADGQTDRPTDHGLYNNRPQLRMFTAMRPNNNNKIIITRMWANAQRDGRPTEYRWRPVLKAAKFGSRPLLACSNAAKTRKPLKFAGVPQTNETISAASKPKFAILWGHVEEVLLLIIFFRLSISELVAKT